MNIVKYNNDILWGTIPHWPKIPEHLLEYISNYNMDELQYEGKGLRVGTYKNQLYKNSLYKRWPVLPELESWIRTNISANFNQIGIQEINPVVENTKLLVHCDKEPRRWTILYILDLGGDNIHTNFYQEKNNPLVREYGYTVNDLDNLNHLASAKFNTHSWVFVNGLILHDLDPLISSRIAITGSIWSENPFDDLKLNEIDKL